MLIALYRKARADIRSHKLQYALMLAMLTMATLMLTVALIVQRSADTPWERTFETTNGPHAWLVSGRSDLDFGPAAALPEVSQTSGEIPTLANHPLVIGDEKYEVFLYGLVERPPVAQPQVVAGRWLAAEGVDEIVLDFSLARYYGFEVGETVDVLTAEGTRPLAIVGLAVNAHWFPYTDDTKDLAPGVAYILPATLAEIEPDPAERAKVMGFRLRDPQASQEFVERAYEVLDNQLATSLEWQTVRDWVTFTNRINVLFLSFFSLLGLAAVGLIIANSIGGQVLAQYREIGLLKAAGFKPGQVVWLFLLEHLAVGWVATVLGLGLGIAAAPTFSSPIAALLNTSAPAVYDPALLLSIGLTIEGAVVLFTLLPAWQGGRIDTVQAISVGYAQTPQRASRLAWLAGRLRLPPVIILGLKDVFSRPLRTTLTIVGLLVTVVVATFTVGAQATITTLGENRTYFQGTPADLRLTRNFVPDSLVRQKLADTDQVTRYYTQLGLFGRAEGHSDSPIFIRALADDYQNFDFGVVAGRMFNAPGEAVMGAGLLNLLNLAIGDEVTLLVDGRPLTLTIVGRYMELYNIGRVALTSLETVHQQLALELEPQVYGLAVAGGADAQTIRRELIAFSEGQFDVLVTSPEPSPPAVQLRSIAISLGVIILTIAGANLFSTTLLGIRERVRDFGVQKTLGVTPGQIAVSVITGVCAVALLALALGLPLGLAIYDQFMAYVGGQIGAGAEFGRMDWQLLALLLPGAVLLAVVSSIGPARRAAGLEVAEALRYE
ncbi:MAG: FtsX-like permease family protein [Chloroflexota bacterium]